MEYGLDSLTSIFPSLPIQDKRQKRLNKSLSLLLADSFAKPSISPNLHVNTITYNKFKEPTKTLEPISYRGETTYFKRDMSKMVESLEKLIGPQNIIHSYESTIKKTSLKPKLIEKAKKIINARISQISEVLAFERSSLLNQDILDVIIFDIQVTGIPEVINVNNENIHLSYPSIIQFSFYRPSTGEHLTSYVKGEKPITFDASLATGIYNSFELSFYLPVFTSDEFYISNPESINIQYINNSLIDRREIVELATKYEENGHSIENAIEMAIQEFLETNDNDLSPVLSLDAMNSPYFHEKLPDIIEFLNRGNSDTTTILLSRNGSKLSVPIFLEEMKKFNADSVLNDVIFLDIQDLVGSIVLNNNLQLRDDSDMDVINEILSTIELNFSSKTPDAYNSVVNVMTSWINITNIIADVYSTKDIEFIYSKIVEELYLRKLKR